MTRGHILAFTFDEWKWIIVIVMLGIIMYWTAYVIEPTNTLIEEARETQQAIQNTQDVILSNQENNTLMIKEIVNKTEAAEKQDREAFFALQMEHDNTTEAIRETQKRIIAIQLQNNETATNLTKLVSELSEADQFNIQWEKDDRTRSGHILDNVTLLRGLLENRSDLP